MIEQLGFYYKHSLNDLRANGQRTFFALLAIAAGVAAIVSLLTLGVMIDDTLTGSLQESNRGDIRISIPFTDDLTPEEEQVRDEDGVVETLLLFNERVVSEDGLNVIRDWMETSFPGEIEMTFLQFQAGFTGVAVSVPSTDAVNPLTQAFIVEAAKYPLYGAVETEDGRRLSEALREPGDILISRNLADALDVEVGDTLRVSGVSIDFTIRGIVPTDTEGGFDNIFAGLVGYYYVDLSALPFFEDLEPSTNQIYWRLQDPSRVEEIDAAFEARFPYLDARSTEDLREDNATFSDTLNDLVSVMGLVALLIGGIGIVNTMNVVVRRRRVEVAVLKTIGLEAEQVTILFMVEAFLMGVIGSLAGILVGWVLTFGVKGVAEGFVGQTLAFRITAGPPLTGLIVGVLITTIFGFLPTLSAGQVRPGIVLRPADSPVAKAGRARSLAALIVVILAISLVAQPMIGGLFASGEEEASAEVVAAESAETSTDAPSLNLIAAGVGAGLGLVSGLAVLAGKLLGAWTRGILWRRIARWLIFLIITPLAAAAFGFLSPAVLFLLGTFIIAGILYVLLWLVIWVIARLFPAFGFIDLKIALRAILATRGRAATTLLALVVGIFTLSLLTMLTTAIRDEFERVSVDQVGGNVIVFASGGTLERVEERLSAFEGVESYAVVGAHEVELIAMEDVSAGEIVTMNTLRQRAIDADPGGIGDSLEILLENAFRAIDARELANLPMRDIREGGRQLTPEDAGQPVMVMIGNEATLAAGIEVGDRLTFGLTDGDPEVDRITLEIVGITDDRGFGSFFGSPNYAPIDAFPPELQPGQLSAIVQVEETRVRDLQRAFDEIPGSFVLETRLLNDVFNRLFQQFTAFPILVAALSLLTGGIVIANSVALATMERRREIAIMKAVGLQRERVLSMLLLENGIMGLIGGLIGVGLGALILFLMLTLLFEGAIGNAIPYGTALVLMLLALAITLLASILTVWRASGEKPLTVLRYE